MVATSVKVLMSRREAVECLSRIKSGLDGIRGAVEQIKEDLLDLQEREGWRALGYTSWRACATAEFNKSQSQVYKLLTAAKVAKQISLMREIDEPPQLPQRVAQQLTNVPEEVRPELFEAAKAAAGGKRPTEEQVKREVEKFRDEQKSTDELIEEEEEEEEEEERKRKVDDLNDALTRWYNSVEKVLRQMEGADPKMGATTLRLGREFLGQIEKEKKKWGAKAS